MSQYKHNVLSEAFEGTKCVIRRWKLKDRQHNGQKRTNSVLKTIINNTLNIHDKETRTQHKVV